MAKDKVMKRRFECSNSEHSKFWEFTEVGPGKFLAGWGKIGKEPQGTKLYTEQEIEALIPEKSKKGYQEVTVRK